MATPQFSVIITCHNQRKFIADAVQSAISQIYESREVIVVDDASSDGSDSVLKSYGEMIRLISLERNQGASEARNAGTAAARGNYLVYLDGDDLLKPWALLVYETRKCDCAGYLEPGIIVASGNTGTPIRRLLAEVTNLRCLA